MPENPDRKILELFREHGQREAAFTMLTEAYSERLYWHIRRIVIDHQDADDVLQNTLIKVWKHLDHFRAESGLFTWLFRIATNESLSLIKERKKHLHNPEDQAFENGLAETLKTDPWFDGDEVQLKLQQAILSLPEKQRLVFNLKYFEEMKYEEMSETLQTSVGALKASYHHAVKKIEKYITGE
jgi:RNA polymerase sigma-70 factor (ECF subfamily)